MRYEGKVRPATRSRTREEVMRKTVVATVVLLALGAVYLIAQAGDLEPPGAPAPTMKTLDEVEARIPIHQADIPLTITQPGSYYLAENLDLTGLPDPANTTAIEITVDNVTVDLNGFAITGPTVCSWSRGFPSSGSTNRPSIKRSRMA